MTAEKWEKTEIEFAAIRVTFPVEHEDDVAMLNGVPGFNGRYWTITLDVDTEAVREWSHPTLLDVCLKVRDEGKYELLAPDGTVLKTLEDCYVPRCLPQGFGDYFEPTIAPDGDVTNWAPSSDQIAEDFFGDEW